MTAAEAGPFFTETPNQQLHVTAKHSSDNNLNRKYPGVLLETVTKTAAATGFSPGNNSC